MGDAFWMLLRPYVREALFLDLSLRRSFGIGAFKPCLGASVDTKLSAKLTAFSKPDPSVGRSVQKPGRYCS